MSATHLVANVEERTGNARRIQRGGVRCARERWDACALPLRSVHTENFPALLRELNASLMITTYQAGKLVFVRADGAALNTHFLNFRSPMGLALDGRPAGDRLVVADLGVPQCPRDRREAGAGRARWTPASCPGRRTSRGPSRSTRWPGERGDELWFVNTRFSCLCTRDPIHSFVPRWRPPFITELTPDDRCHLNGLAMVDGQPRFVTAHGSIE